MKDFYQFREAYSINRQSGPVRSGGGITSGGGDGHSDGQSDSGVERKGQDKDYRHLLDINDHEDQKVYRELINLYGYKDKIAAKTVMRNNPDIRKIDRNGKISY
jgi:hypothetical protein